MADPTYKVIVSGEILPGHDIGETKKHLAAAFKLPAETVERFFIGKPVVVKSNTDLQTAEKYKTLIEKAGAVCSIKQVQQTAVSSAPNSATSCSCLILF